jgi:hypothetical protein
LRRKAWTKKPSAPPRRADCQSAAGCQPNAFTLQRKVSLCGVASFFLDFFAGVRYILVDGTVTTDTLDSGKTALDALTLFQAALPAEFFEQQRKAAGQPPEKGVYTAAVVIALVILQRLIQGKGTLSGAVQQVLTGRFQELPPRHKRIQEGTLSGNPGAYCRARTRLPQAAAEMAADQVVEYLLAERQEALPGLGRQSLLSGRIFG